MSSNFSISVWGQLGGNLGINESPQLFFAQCSKCGKYAWNFGYFNGSVYCFEHLNEIVTNLKKEYISHDTNSLLKLKIESIQRNLLIYSIIYYKFSTNIIPDSVWDSNRNELNILIAANLELAKETKYFSIFQDMSNSGLEWALTDEFLKENYDLVDTAILKISMKKLERAR